MRTCASTKSNRCSVSREPAIAHLRMALQTSRIVTLPAQTQPPRTDGAGALARRAVGSQHAARTDRRHRAHDAAPLLHRRWRHAARRTTTLPPYDVLFNTIAESERARPALTLAQRVRRTRRAAAGQRAGRSSRDSAASDVAAAVRGVGDDRRAGGRTRRGRGAARAHGHRAARRAAGRLAGRHRARARRRLRQNCTRISTSTRYAAYFVMPFVDYQQRRRLLPQVPRDVRRAACRTRATSRSHRAG